MQQPGRRIASVLLLFLAATLLTSAATGTFPRVGAQSPASVRVEPIGTRVDWSDGPFSVRIELSGLDHHGTISYDDDRDTEPDRAERSDGLGAFEIDLHFDPAVVRVSGAQAGDFLGSSGRSTQCLQRTPEAGQYALGCVSVGSAPGPQGSGTLAVITFDPVTSGVSFLGLEVDLAGPLSDSIPVSPVGGIVEVFSGPEAVPTPGPEERPPGRDDTPTVLDGGELGDVTPPEGDTGPGARNGDDSSPTAHDVDSARGSLPSTGVHHQPPGTTLRPLMLGGGLAAIAVALLLIGSRLAMRARRP